MEKDSEPLVRKALEKKTSQICYWKKCKSDTWVHMGEKQQKSSLVISTKPLQKVKQDLVWDLKTNK